MECLKNRITTLAFLWNIRMISQLHLLRVHSICSAFAGILGDKTMDVQLMYVLNGDNNYNFCRLKLLVEKFGHF